MEDAVTLLTTSICGSPLTELKLKLKGLKYRIKGCGRHNAGE